MPSQEIDISWQVLRRIVRDWAGESAELAEVKPLAGGMINTTLAVATKQGDRAVLKISPHRVNLQHEEEAYQLNLLGELGMPVPQIFHWSAGSLDIPASYLLMEHIDGCDLAQARQQCDARQYDQLQEELAEMVLKLHEHTSPHYMRIMEESTPHEDWVEFFHSVYDPIWQETEKSGLLPVKVRKQVAKLHAKLDRLIIHDDTPRLCHWDIWTGNILARPNGEGNWHVAALLDPNCKYAHLEGELAYMELFQTITPTFIKAYQRKRRLSPEYGRYRKHIYQVYHLMNHVRLFGQEYLKPFLAAVDRATAAG